MTFTYTPSTPSDITRVRFHIADTDATAYRYSDEEITMLISETGTWQKTVIACIEGMIADIASNPDFKADWLQVDSSKSLAGLQALLQQKRRSLGINAVVGRTVNTYRADSLSTESPDYDNL